MTFQRILQNGWTDNEDVLPASLNQLDIDHAKSLDKTGDTVAMGGGITGAVEITSTGALIVDGYILTKPNSTFTNDGYFISTSGYFNTTLGTGSSITTSGTGTITSGANGSFVLNGSSTDFIKLNTARTRTIIVPINADGYSTTWTAGLSGITATAVGNTVYVSLQDRVHQGATLSGVTLNFAVGVSHTGVPSTLPSLAVYCMTASGTSANLGSPVSPSPATGSAWYNGGNPQTLTYTPSTNNVIDIGTYYYKAVITDEFGTNSQVGNQFYSLTLTLSSISQLLFQ